MVQDVNEFGKRRAADDDGTLPSSKRRSGLHRFAQSPSPAADLDAVQDRYQKLVQASFALRGAIGFQDAFPNASSPAAYGKERERCVAEFHRTLPAVLADTRSLDSDRQTFLVDMACNTEKVADAGKGLNLACKHLDDFEETPRAMLLLKGIRAFANVPPNARTELFGHLSSAIGKGYLGKPHLDALNEGQLGMPTEISRPFSVLARELGPAVAARPDSNQSASSGSWKTPKLDELPPEILQNIVLRAIEPDLRKDKLNGLEGLDGVLETANAIGLTNKRLRAHSDELKLLGFGRESTKALSIASKRYGDFLVATSNLFAIEDSENFDADSARYQEAVKKSSSATEKLFPVIKLMGAPEQSKMISTFCQFRHPVDLTSLMVAASEHTDDLCPKPRSEMFASLIHILPHVSDVPGFQQIAHDRLAKAELAGQLDRRHYNALAIAELDLPGLRDDISERIAGLREAALNPPATVEPELPPLIPADAVADHAVAKIIQGRQDLLQKLDDRAFSR